MIRLVMLTIILVIGFAVLIPAKPSQGGPSDFIDPISAICGLGCWDGIRPGKTTMQEAEALLQQNPNIAMNFHAQNMVFWTEILPLDPAGRRTGGIITPKADGDSHWDGQSVVANIFFRPWGRHQLSLGDAFFLWGKPVGYSTFCQTTARTPSAIVQFSGNILLEVDAYAQLNRPDLTAAGLTPYSMVRGVTYFAPDYLVPTKQLPWTGFLQFAPNDPVNQICE